MKKTKTTSIFLGASEEEALHFLAEAWGESLGGALRRAVLIADVDDEHEEDTALWHATRRLSWNTTPEVEQAAEELRRLLSRGGVRLTRSDAIRYAIVAAARRMARAQKEKPRRDAGGKEKAPPEGGAGRTTAQAGVAPAPACGTLRPHGACSRTSTLPRPPLHGLSRT